MKQALRETQTLRAAYSTSPPLREGRTVVFPPPELEIILIATTPVPESELTVEVGDPPTTGHLEENVLYSEEDFTVQPALRPAYRPRVVTIKQPFHQQIPLTFTRSLLTSTMLCADLKQKLQRATFSDLKTASFCLACKIIQAT